MELIIKMNEPQPPFYDTEDDSFLEELENRYEFEDKVYLAVNQGLPDLVPSIFDGFINKPLLEAENYAFKDYIAAAKIFCHCLNLTGRIAARSGGLPSIYLHKISQDFGIIINNTSNIICLINQLPREIIIKYATAVAELSTTKYSPLVIKAVQYISNHLTDTIEATEIANTLYVSPEHLSRKFKADTGKTIPDYINSKRISMAKILLSRKSKNITDIAIQVGYRDSSYFSKAFKKAEGMSPTQYLNQLKFNKKNHL